MSSGPSEPLEGPSNIATTCTLEDATSLLTGLKEPRTPMPTAYHSIYSLPDELLAAVFQSYSDETIAKFRKERLTTWKRATIMAYSWLRIRHVCRLWREIACSSPSLHTHIVLADPECVADQLRRSGGLPLSVYAIHGYYRLSPQTILDSCRLVFRRQPTRIRYVLLQWTASLDSALQSPEFSEMDLPNLQDLHLLPTLADKDTTNLSPSFYYFTPFSGMQLSCLRSYSCEYGVLRSYLFDTLLHKPLHRTLRCLKFTSMWTCSPPSGSGPVPPMPNIFDLLDELALLEELELQVTECIAFREPDVNRKTALRHLTNLRLCEDDIMGAATHFLAFLVYPATAHTTVESHLVFRGWLHIAEAEAEVIASRFAGRGVVDGIPLGDPRFMKLDMGCGMNGAEIQLWNASVMSTIDPVDPKLPLPIVTWRILSSSYSQETMMHVFLSCVLEMLPLTNVAGMVIAHGCYDYPCLSLADIVHTFRRLTGIRVLGTHGLLFVGELAKAMQDDTGGQIFPHLRHWRISGLERVYAVPKDVAHATIHHALEQLGTALLHRRKTGAGLKFLELDTGYKINTESDKGVAVVLSPDIIGELERLQQIAQSRVTVDRTFAKLMVITNSLASTSGAV